MSFVNRHIGLKSRNITNILNNLGFKSKTEFIKKIIPNKINYSLKNFDSQVEYKALNDLKKFQEQDYKYLIGIDYNSSILPNVIKKNLLENPKWYTSYSPYQSEISQGRLESLFNYQTLICELTKLPISNCSLLDTGSACGEAMTMAYASHKYKKNKFFIDKNIHPHLTEVVKTRAEALDIDLVIDDLNNINIENNLFGVLTSYPDTYGSINYNTDLYKELNRSKKVLITHNDLLSLMFLKPPGELGVNISVGTTQRFGLPLWFGGPHSAFMSCDKNFQRFIPGRIVGLTKDRNNDSCFRLALQTREQHIRKDKALSNICTSQALLSNTSSMYAIYHGKDGLKNISKNIIINTLTIKNILNEKFIDIIDNISFDTITIKTSNPELLKTKFKNKKYYPRVIDTNHLSISLNETNDFDDYVNIINILIANTDVKYLKPINKSEFLDKRRIIERNINFEDNKLYRQDNFLDQNIFRESKNETFMMRYINKLVDKDYSLVSGMIPLGSCTMKLNSSTQMTPITFDAITNAHPYSDSVPIIYKKILSELTDYLLNVTNMYGISFSPNSGAMGEYAGLLCIKKYHESNNESHRNICLIPYSAHGTNFASASMCNLKIIKFDDNISLEDFEDILKKNKDNLNSMMITYPNTYGIFNEDIKEFISLVHKYGGLVYMDGANMNAQSGLTSPGTCGADVCHLNLHKTFCIPHGGGGPGMGPICVNEKLYKFLPENVYTTNKYDNKNKVGMITNSLYSSASILTIPYLYFKNMGSDGIKEATIIALLNANYLKNKLQEKFTIYSENDHGLVGHEFIIDLNEFKEYGITDKDVSKRLIDYGFHPPTMSWPIPNSIMIEPTESESKEELDRFIDAMNGIYEEIMEIKEGKVDKNNNVLVNSPHSYSDLINWNFDYSIEKACFPNHYLKKHKFWPSNSRIDDVYGDKNLVVKYD